MAANAETILHASAVAIGGRAVLLLGRSGSGKSSLALELLALGGGLISDDRTILTATDGALVAGCPPTIAGRIEARGVGILACPPHPASALSVAVDLDNRENDRLPPLRQWSCLGLSIDLLHKSEHTHFPAAIRLYLLHGRSD